MKKFFYATLVAIGLSQISFDCFADIQIFLPEGSDITKIDYYYAPISKLASAKSSKERGIIDAEALVKDHKATIEIPGDKGGYRFGFSFSQNNFIDLFASTDDNVIINVNSLDPFDFTLSGSQITNAMNTVKNLEAPFKEKQKELMAKEDNDDEAIRSIYEEYQAALSDFVKQNPASPTSAYVLLYLNTDDFLELAEDASPEIKSSILFPFIENKVSRTKEEIEKQKIQHDMEEKGMEAPGFTLKDLNGQNVSLSEFKGKWVILDFWGSWCIWCIKGFPELKDAYAKYQGKLEILGIDCNESEEAWRAGVEKYELPWVNVYCPAGDSLISKYGVQGFPTKAIVDPEGKIRNITTGHNLEFFNILERLIGE